MITQLGNKLKLFENVFRNNEPHTGTNEDILNTVHRSWET